MIETIKKYQKQIIIAVVVVIILIAIWYWWNQKSKTTVKIVDDQGNQVVFTPEQTNQATAIADRLYNDLNSGWMFGYNWFGTIGRDDEAYMILSQMSDSLFALTYRTYESKYHRSLIADIRGESSISGAGIVDAILSKATRLTLP